MQIPGHSPLFGPSFQRPQPGARPQYGPELQGKATVSGGPQVAQVAGRAPKTGLAGSQTLEQAVQALSAEGRLPPRGSLVDLLA